MDVKEVYLRPVDEVTFGLLNPAVMYFSVLWACQMDYGAYYVM